MSTITDAIKKDHRELVEYYNNILHAPDDDTATRWQNQFTWELCRYLVAKELIVYPAFEKNLGEKGRIITDKNRSEHQRIKEKLNNFQSLKAGAIEFIPLLECLMDDLVQHINEEELADLPALDGALSSEDSKSLRDSFRHTKAFVPSRSHPMAPNKPPFETVASLIATPLDYIGDLFRKFPDETATPNPCTK